MSAALPGVGVPVTPVTPIAPVSATTAALLRRTWLLLAAAFVAQLPATAASLFLADIATDLSRTVALVGGARGVGGVAALLVGLLAAPLIDRLPRAWSISLSLGALAIACVAAAAGTFPSLLVFYLAIGAAGAVLMPSLQAASADGVSGPDGARAAALLGAAGSVTAILAGPVLALPAAYWGWRGDFLAIAVLCLPLAALSLRSLSHAPPSSAARLGYVQAFRRVAAAPGALALLFGSTLRAALFVGWVSYVAAYFVQQLHGSATVVTLAWTVGGLAYFAANVATGRLINATATAGTGWRSAERLLGVALVTTIATAPALYLSPTALLALVATALHSLAHGVFFACVISLFVRRYPDVRGAVMGLNMAGFNVGVFAGTALAGLGLGLAGWSGLATALTALAVVTAVITILAIRRPPSPSPLPQTS